MESKFSKKTIWVFVGLFLIFLAGTTKKANDTADLTVSPTPEVMAAVTDLGSEIETESTYKVEHVIDGDTIELEDGQRVRLIGIDTPETVDPNRPVGCYGKEASTYTKSRLEGKQVILEKDVSETDRYGRLLRYAWIGEELFNETLVREGYAQVATYPPDVKYQERFLQTQRLAREEMKGLWGESCMISPTPRPTSMPASSLGVCLYVCSGPDKDCSDFSTHAQAQAFFECCGWSAGNDPMRLDKANGVGNGLACESLP